MSSSVAWPPNYLNVAKPTTSDRRLYQIAYCHARNALDTANINITTSITIDLQKIGINGLSQGTFIRTGTVSITVDSQTLTGTNTSFLSWFKTRDCITVVSGEIVASYVIQSVVSDTQITLNTPSIYTIIGTSQFYRGISSNLPPRAALYFYALGHPKAPGYIVTTRNVEVGDLLTDVPSNGYTIELSRQIPFYITTDSLGEVNSGVYPLDMDDTSAGVTVPFATTSEVISGTSLTTVVSPATLRAAISSFDNVQTIIGIFATNDESKDRTIIDKAIVPSNLTTIFSRPGIIGNSIASAAYFTDLTAQTLGGEAVASLTDLQSALGGSNAKDTKLVTIRRLLDVFTQATAIGNTSAKGTFNSISVAGITGSAIATKQTDIGKVLTADIIPTLFKSPAATIGSDIPVDGKFKSITATSYIGPIGSVGNTNTAYVSDLYANTITGPFLANVSDVLAGSSTSKIMTPSNIGTFMANPGIIGATTSNNAFFKKLYAETATGPFIANATEVLDPTLYTKIVTPQTLSAYFAAPTTTIGSLNKAQGRFSNLIADTITTTKLIMPPSGLPTNYIVMAIPRSSNFRLWSIDYINARNAGNSYDIIINTPSVVDILSNGLNGQAQSQRLTGSIGVTSGSNVVFGTGTTFTTDFQVGDTIVAANIVQRVISIQSATQLTVLSPYPSNYTGYCYRNGASLTGLAPFTTYYLYALGDVSLTPGFIMSPRNTFGGDTLNGLPTGYSTTFIRQTPYTFTTDYSGLLNGPPVPSAVKDTSTGVFLAPANQTEVRAQTTFTKGLTPGNIPDIMGSPGALGFVSPNIAQFTDVTMNTINGTVVALNADATAMKSSAKVLTPSVIPSIFAKPPVMGSITPNDITALTLSASTIAGSVIASSSEAKAMAISNKVLTPAVLPTVLASPGNIGQITPGDAKFKALTAGSLNIGSIMIETAFQSKADMQISGVVYSSIVSAASLLGTVGNDFSKSPGTFTTLKSDSITGQVVANDTEAVALSSESKVVTPASVKKILASPGVIGSTKPSNAYFSTVYASTLVLDFPVSQKVSQLPTKFVITTPPKAVDGTYTSYTIGYTLARNESDSVDVRVTSSKVLSFANVGQINGPTVSGNLLGTVTGFVGTTLLSGDDYSTNFDIDFVVGDVIVIAGINYKVAQILGPDQMVLGTPMVSNVYQQTYKRASVLVPSNTYYFYAIQNATAPGYLISTRSVIAGHTLVDVPTGYDANNSRQLAYGVTTDSNGQLFGDPLPIAAIDTTVGTPPVYATDTQAIAKVDSFKTITPANLPSIMANPGPIGGSAASTGTFTTLSANNVGGSMIASGTTITGKSSNTTILTPGGIPTMMASPGPIGSTAASTGAFTTITASSTVDASITTQGGITIQKGAYVGGALTTAGNVKLSSTTPYTSETSAALVVDGDSSFRGNLYTKGSTTVGGNLDITGDVNISGSLDVAKNIGFSGTTTFDGITYFGSAIDATATNTGAVQITGGASINKTLIIGATARVLSTTDATSSTTGAITTSGGIGIAKSLNVGTNATVGGTATITGSLAAGSINTTGSISAGAIAASGDIVVSSGTDAVSSTTGSIIAGGGIGVKKNIVIGGNTTTTGLYAASSADSSGSTSGAITTSGGIGVAKSVSVGGDINVSGQIFSANTTDSSGSTSGAIITGGGLGVGKNINVGGAASITGNASVGGTLSSTGSVTTNGNVSSAGYVVAGGVISSTATTSASNSTTGAITATGGIATQDSIYVGKNATISGSLSSGSANVNTLYVASNSGTSVITVGGVGIGGNALVGGDLQTNSDLYVVGKIISNAAIKSASETPNAFDIAGDASIGGSLYTIQDIVGFGNFSIVGSSSLIGNTDVGGALTVSDTTDATTSTTGSIIAGGGVGVGKSINVGGGVTSAGAVVINDSTSSVSTLTGALIVKGGIATKENISVAGNVNLTANKSITWPSYTVTGGSSLKVIPTGSGGVSFRNYGDTADNLTISTDGIVTLTNTTDASSTTAAALVIGGGLGITKSLKVGGDLSVSGSEVLTGTMTMNNTTNSTSSTTGAFTMLGGAGVKQDLYVGGNVSTGKVVFVGSTTNATSTSTGSLTTVGGIGIAKDAHIGGNIVVSGTLSQSGGTLNVASNQKVTGTLEITSTSLLSGDVHVGSTATTALVVDGGMSVAKTMAVTGAATLGSTLSTSGAVTFGSTLGVTGATTLSSTLDISGATTMKSISATTGTFSDTTNAISSTTGSITTPGGIGIAKDMYIGGKVTSTTLTSGVTNLGTTTLSSATVTGNVAIGGTLSSGAATLDSANITGALVVGGAINSGTTTTTSLSTGALSATSASITGATTVTGAIGVSGSAVVGGTLQVQSTTDATSTVSAAMTIAGGLGVGKQLKVGGNTTISGSAAIGSNMTVAGPVHITDTTADSALHVDGGTRIGGDLFLEGDLSMAGALSVPGIEASTSTVTVGGALIVPVLSNAQSLIKVNGAASGSVSIQASGTGSIPLKLEGSSAQVSIGSNYANYIDVQGTAGGTKSVMFNANGSDTDISIVAAPKGNGNLHVISGVASSSASTGSIVADGGLGVAGNIHAGGDVRVHSVTPSTNATSGALVVDGGLGVGDRLNVQGNAMINSSTGSTDVNSGALVVKGGVGVAGTLNASSVSATTIYASATVTGGTITTAGVLSTTNTSSGALAVSGGATIEGVVSLTNSTDSTSTSTGALVVSKGFAVGGTAHIQNLHVDDTTDTVGTTSGALIVEGGLAVKKSVTVGADLTVIGELILSSPDAMALSMEGGAKIVGDLTVDDLVVNGTTDSTDYDTGAIICKGGLGVASKLNVGGIAKVYSAQDATSTNNAALVTVGGIGTGGSIISGGTIKSVNTTNSSSSVTGSIIAMGGLGVQKDIKVGGSVDAAGDISGVGGTLNTLYVGSNSGTAVTVVGGISAGGKAVISGDLHTNADLYVVGKIISNASITSASETPNAFDIAGDASIGGSMYVIQDIVGFGDFSVTGNASILGTNNSMGHTEIFDTTDATSSTTGALIVDGGLAIQKNTFANGRIIIVDSTDSVSSTTGSITTTGGLGVAKNATLGSLSVINDAVIQSSTEATSSTSAALTVVGGLGVSKSIVIGGALKAISTVDSTSSTTGAVTVSGGLGVQKNVNIGGTCSVTGVTTLSDQIVSSSSSTNSTVLSLAGTYNATSSTTGSLTTLGGIGVAKDLYAGGVVSGSTIRTNSTSTNTTVLAISGTYDATSSTTGSVTMSGGLGVAKSIVVGGSITSDTIIATTALTVMSSYDATNSASGSITTLGGVGIAKGLYVGTTATVGSTATATSNSGALVVAGGINTNGIWSTGETVSSGKVRLNDVALMLRAGSDMDNFVKYTATGDGPRVCGLTGGSLAYGGASETVALSWNNTSVGVSLTTDATSTTSGSITTSGGIGVAKNIYVGGNVNLTSNGRISFTSSSMYQSGTSIRAVPGTSGSFVIRNSGDSDDLFSVSATGAANATTVAVSDTTTSSSSTTGSITTSGGIGVVKDAIIGGAIGLAPTLSSWDGSVAKALEMRVGSSINSSLHYLNSTVGLNTNSYFNGGWKYYSNAPSSIYWQESGAHKWGSAGGAAAGTPFTYTSTMLLSPAGVLSVYGTTDSTSSTTGAITTIGGLGVTKSIYAGGNINAAGTLTVGGTTALSTIAVSSTTATSSTNTGSITTLGGIGVAGGIYAGNNITTTGDIIASTATIKGDVNTLGNAWYIYNDGNALQYPVGGVPPGVRFQALGGGSTNNNYMQFPDLTLGGLDTSSSFTIEFPFKADNTGASLGGVVLGTTAASNTYNIRLETSNRGVGSYPLTLSIGSGSSYDIANAVSLGTGSAGNLQTFVLMYNAGTRWTAYINGIRVMNITSSTAPHNNFLQTLAFHQDGALTGNGNGDLDLSIISVRVTKGLVYNDTLSNITAASYPYTSLQTTVLLNNFNSTDSNYTLVQNLDVSEQVFANPAYASSFNAVAKCNKVSATYTTDSYSSTTGAITTTGGLGVVKNATIGGALNLSSTSTNTSTLAVSGSYDASSSTTGSITTTGGLGVAKSIYAGGAIRTSSTATNTSTLIVSGTYDATSSTTGSITTVGGIGVAKNVYAGGSITGNTVVANTTMSALGATDASSSTTGSITTTGGLGVTKSAYIGGGLNVAGASTLSSTSTNTTVLSITGTYDATNSTSGSIITGGGIGVTKSVNIGGGLTVAGTSSLAGLGLSNTTDASSSTTGSMTTAGGLGVQKSVVVGGSLTVAGTGTYSSTSTNTSVLSISGTYDATSSMTGSIATAGGISAQRNIYAGAGIIAGSTSTNTTVLTVMGSYDSTSSTTGSFTTSGGIGLAKGITVGGNAMIAGNLTLSSASTNTTVLAVSDTYDASSSTTGSVTTSGGIGIAKSANIGGGLTVAGTSTLSAANVSGVTTFTNTTAASNSTTAAVVVNGGLAVGGSAYFNPEIITNGGIRLNNSSIYIRTVGDNNHYIKYLAACDGPYIMGSGGGALAAAGNTIAQWSSGGFELPRDGSGVLLTGAHRILRSYSTTKVVPQNTSSCYWTFRDATDSNDTVIINNNGATTLYYSLDASSSTSASLVTYGGIGVGKNIISGGNIALAPAISSWDSSVVRALELRSGSGVNSGLHYLNGTVGINSNSYFNGGWKYYSNAPSSIYWQETGAHNWGSAAGDVAGTLFNYTPTMSLSSAGVLSVPGTTDSTSSTTGTFTTMGGIGVNKSMYVGGNINLRSGSAGIYFGSPVALYQSGVNLRMIPGVSGKFVVRNNADSSDKLTISEAGKISCFDNTDSTSFSTGSISTIGGMGVTANLYVGGKLMITGTRSLNNVGNAWQITMSGATIQRVTTTGARFYAPSGGSTNNNYMRFPSLTTTGFTTSTPFTLEFVFRNDTQAAYQGVILGTYTSSNGYNIRLETVAGTRGDPSITYQLSLGSGSSYDVFATAQIGGTFGLGNAYTFVFMYNPGTRWTAYLNGTRVVNVTTSTLIHNNFLQSLVFHQDGTMGATGNGDLDVSFLCARVNYGLVYDDTASSITPASYPYTAITNTIVLNNFDDTTGNIPTTFDYSEQIFSSNDITNCSVIGMSATFQKRLVVSCPINAYGTSTSSAALAVTGGAVIKKNLNVGGSINATGNGLLYYIIGDTSGSTYNFGSAGRILGTGIVANLPYSQGASTWLPDFYGASTSSAYCVILQGWISYAAGGIMYFSIVADDIVRVYIAGSLIASRTSAGTVTGSYIFTAAKWAPIKIELQNTSGPGILSMRWTTNSDATTGLVDIPSTSLWYAYVPDMACTGGPVSFYDDIRVRSSILFMDNTNAGTASTHVGWVFADTNRIGIEAAGGKYITLATNSTRRVVIGDNGVLLVTTGADWTGITPLYLKSSGIDTNTNRVISDTNHYICYNNTYDGTRIASYGTTSIYSTSGGYNVAEFGTNNISLAKAVTFWSSLHLTDHVMYLRGSATSLDSNHGIGYNSSHDGPNIFGSGAVLLTAGGNIVVKVDSSARAYINGDLLFFNGTGGGVDGFTSRTTIEVSNSSGRYLCIATGASERILVGTATTKVLNNLVNASGTSYSTSDIRLKTNVEDLTLDTARHFVEHIDPVVFEWKSKLGIKQYGYIAQDVMHYGYSDMLYKVDDHVEEYTDEYGTVYPAGSSYAMSYDSAIPMLHVVVKDILAENAILKKRVSTLESQIAEIRAVLGLGL